MLANSERDIILRVEDTFFFVSFHVFDDDNQGESSRSRWTFPSDPIAMNSNIPQSAHDSPCNANIPKVFARSTTGHQPGIVLLHFFNRSASIALNMQIREKWSGPLSIIRLSFPRGLNTRRRILSIILIDRERLVILILFTNIWNFKTSFPLVDKRFAALRF